MGEILPKIIRENNMSSVQKYVRKYSNNKKMHVVAKKENKSLFDDKVEVTIKDGNIYFNANIVWEDKKPDYRNIGLHGSYSTHYYNMKYSNGALKISGDGISITISE